MNQSQHKQILAVFWRQEYRSHEFRDIGDGQEVDVTAQVLSLDAEQIHAMEDDTDSTNDLVIAADLGHDGPHRATVTEAICGYFGVRELQEITRQDLAEAWSRHGKMGEHEIQLLPEGWSMRETALSRAYHLQGGDAQVTVNKDKIDRGSMTIRVYGERTWSGYEGATAGYVPLRVALTRAQETLADPSSHLSAYGVQMVEAGKAARDKARAAGWDQDPERGIYRVDDDQVRVSSWGEALALDRKLPQALPPTSRTEPDQLTLSYVAIGAHAAVRAAGRATPAHALDQFEGELGLIGAVAEKALMLDRVADWFDARDGHTGVFSYEVAEPFGTAYANALLSEGAEKDAAEILREVMQSAGYEPSEVEEAFVSELAARIDRRSARIDIPNVDAEAPQRLDVKVSPGGVPRNGPKSAFDAAIDALQLASECGGELDLPVYRDALKGLRKLRDGMLAYDQRLDDAESAPTGDDYNELLALSGLVMPASERASLLNSRVALNTEDGETKPSASGPGF
jgi:hypothetical protein